jgi:hypothetical protein
MKTSEIKRVGEDKIQITINDETFTELHEFFDRIESLAGRRLNEIQKTINKALSDKIKAEPNNANDNLTALNFSNESMLVTGQSTGFIWSFYNELDLANTALKL